MDITFTSTDKGRGCGGSIYDISGTFTSPMYPMDFRNDTKCIWYLKGPPGTRMQLTINGESDHHLFCKQRYSEWTVDIYTQRVTILYISFLYTELGPFSLFII